MWAVPDTKTKRVFRRLGAYSPSNNKTFKDLSVWQTVLKVSHF